MKSLAAQEMWARRLADREDLLFGAGGSRVINGEYADRNRRLILALCEAYSEGYHDARKEAIQQRTKKHKAKP